MMIKHMLFVASSFAILIGSASAQDFQSAKKPKTPGRTFVWNPLAPVGGNNVGNGPLGMISGPMAAVVGHVAGHGGYTDQPTAFIGGPVSVNLFQSDTNPDGTYRWRDLNVTNSYMVTPFDQTFRTTMATTFVQVSFNSQFWIDDDQLGKDGIAIECYLIQTDPSLGPVTRNCYGAPQGQFPVVLGALTQLNGNNVWISFSSYIPALPDQESELIFRVVTGKGAPAKVASIANSQLHLAF